MYYVVCVMPYVLYRLFYAVCFMPYVKFHVLCRLFCAVCFVPYVLCRMFTAVCFMPYVLRRMFYAVCFMLYVLCHFLCCMFPLKIQYFWVACLNMTKAKNSITHALRRDKTENNYMLMSTYFHSL